MTETTKITITNDEPTEITTDFLTYLHYIETHTVKLTKTMGQLTRKDLIPLYARMSEPKLEVNEKSNHMGYPLLHLFFQLAEALELTQKKVVKASLITAINPENVAVFKALTPAEQYVSLLECFWLKANWRELQGGRYHGEPYNVSSLFHYLELLPTLKKMTVGKERVLHDLCYDYGYFLLYFHYFGFWQVELDEEKRNENSYRAKSILLMPFIKQIAGPLKQLWDSKMEEYYNSGDFNYFDKQKMGEKLPQIVALLQPVFKEGQLTTCYRPIKKEIVVGEYEFKVALSGSCWRTIQLANSHTLLDLHNLIQEAFEFDDDHLYAFYMDGKKYGPNCYNSSMHDEGPFVGDQEIGRLHLYEGQTFLYLFDFGDEWEFTVSVLKITEGKAKTQGVIAQSKGESPEQYAW